MADHHPATGGAPADYDGRFGEHFDDEISRTGVWATILGVTIVTVVFMGLMVLYMRLMPGHAPATSASPSLAAEGRQLPPLPRLQAEPEAELEALRHQMETLLGSYGWVDEAAGTVHIPIERAIDLLLEQGLPAAQAAPPAPEAAAEEAEAALEDAA